MVTTGKLSEHSEKSTSGGECIHRSVDLEVVGIGIVVQNNQKHVGSLVGVGENILSYPLPIYTLVDVQVQNDSVFLGPVDDGRQDPKVVGIRQVTLEPRWVVLVGVERESDEPFLAVLVDGTNEKLGTLVSTNLHVVSLVGV